MPDFDFSEPQRQSEVGLILIFTTSLYHIIRNLWVVAVYFVIGEFSSQMLFFAGAGVVLVLLLSLGYSILYFLNFKFHIDYKNEEFVLQKGVISTDVINIPFQKIQQVNFRRNILQRVIGVYSVVVETAGSQDKEVEIKALSHEKANALAERLMAHAEEEQEETEGEPVKTAEAQEGKKTAKPGPQWEHKVSLWTLTKLGLTSNYLRGVGIIIAFYFTLKEQFMLDEALPEDFQDPGMVWAQGKFLLVIFLLVLGMIITVGETLIKYFGLHLQKFRDTLQVEMGLRNNTKVNLRASRIQLLQVLTNPIQKRMQLYQVKISLASSENELEKNQIKVVGLPPEVVAQVKEYFFKSGIKENFKISPSKYLLWKKISRGMIPLVLVAGILYFYAELVTVQWFVAISLTYIVLMSLYNFLYFQRLKLGVSEEFLIRYSGVWLKKEEYLEMFRLQAVSVTQPIWYKRRGLVNLSFHSAGGDIRFSMVPKNEVEPLLNFLLYRIESTERAWM